MELVSGSTNYPLQEIDLLGDGGPSPAVLDPANGDLYVSGLGGVSYGVLNVISSATNTVIAIPQDGVGAQPAVFDPFNGDVYVADDSSGNASVINAATNEAIEGLSISVPGALGSTPLAPTYDSANSDLYFTDQSSGCVFVVSSSTNMVIAKIVAGVQAEAPVYDPANGDIYVANAYSDNVSVIQGSTNRVVASVPVGVYPAPPVYSPSNGDLYVVDNGGTLTPFQNVSIISGSTNRVIGNVSDVGDPSTFPSPYPVATYDTDDGDVVIPTVGNADLTFVSTVSNSIVGAVGVGLVDRRAATMDTSNGLVYVPTTWTLTVVGPQTMFVQNLTANPSTFALGVATTLQVDATGGAGVRSYEWSLPPGCSPSNLTTLQCTPTSPGSYQIWVDVTDSRGQSVTVSTSITVLPTLWTRFVSSPFFEPILLSLGAVLGGVAVVTAILLIRRVRKRAAKNKTSFEDLHRRVEALERSRSEDKEEIKTPPDGPAS